MTPARNRLIDPRRRKDAVWRYRSLRMDGVSRDVAYFEAIGDHGRRPRIRAKAGWVLGMMATGMTRQQVAQRGAA